MRSFSAKTWVFCVLAFIGQGPLAHAFLFMAKPGPELERNCGVTIQTLRPEVNARALEMRVHPAVILAMIDQESQGDCFRTRSESNRTESVGLVQINSGTPGFATCKDRPEDLKRISDSTTLDQLKQGPQCVQNPVWSLAKMAEVWKAKERTLKLPSWTLKLRDRELKLEGFPELDRHPEFRIQLLLAAFNGGERWVAEAATLIAQVNLEKRGVKLNKYHWPDFEGVLLQKLVSVADYQRFIGLKGRLQSFAQSNVDYVKEVLASAGERLRR